MGDEKVLDLQVRATRVDGVRTFWLPIEDQLTACLSFRVGRADETLPTSGITHLVEHLALSRLGAGGIHHPYNGYVDSLTTNFVVKGDEKQISHFLQHVCRSLTSLPLERLEIERRILDSEADQSDGMQVLDSLLRARYGVATFGLPAFREFAPGQVDEQAVAHWAQNRFTADNAVLWVTGPPPEGLRLPLGRSRPYPPVEASNACQDLPAWFGGNGATSALLANLPRSAEASALKAIAQERLRTSLRYEQGVCYSPQAAFSLRDAGTATLLCVAEPVRDGVQEVRDEILGLLDRLACGAIDGEALGAWRQRLLEPPALPGLRTDMVRAHAWDVLVGAVPRDHSTWSRAVQEVTVESVAHAAGEALHDVVYRVPSSLAPSDPWLTEIGHAADTPWEGKVLRPRRQVASLNGCSLVLGPQGVQGRSSSGSSRRPATIAAEACAAVLAWPDGRRIVIGTAGAELDFEPTHWVDGQLATAHIDRVFPATAFIHQPERPQEQGHSEHSSEPLLGWSLFGLLLAVWMVLVLLCFPAIPPVLSGEGSWGESGALLALVSWTALGSGWGVMLRRRRHRLGLFGPPHLVRPWAYRAPS